MTKYDALRDFRPSAETEGSYPGDSGSRIWEYHLVSSPELITLVSRGFQRLLGTDLDREQLVGLAQAASTLRSRAELYGNDPLAAQASDVLDCAHDEIDRFDSAIEKAMAS